MTRQSRMLLVVGMMALIGVSALAMLANRYSRLEPVKSVEDVVPSRAVPETRETPAPSPAGGEPTAPGSEASTAGPATGEPTASRTAAEPDAPPPAAEPTAAQADVAGFVAARQFVHDFLEKNEEARRQFELELDGKLDTQDRNPMYLAKMASMKLGRGKALVGAGMTEERYRELRDAFRLWHDGGELDDPALRAAFEERRAELEALHLGKLEPLDNL